MKKYILALFILLVILAGGYGIEKYLKRGVTPAVPIPEKTIDPDQALKEKVEKFLFTHGSNSAAVFDDIKDKKACSFSLYGYDEKYIYGYGICQAIELNEDGKLFVGNYVGDAMRVAYLGSDFAITGYEIPTSMCSECPGTTTKDILPSIYYNDYIKNIDEDYRLLGKENVVKMLTSVSITEDITIFLANEYFSSDLSSELRKSEHYPNGDTDLVGSEKRGWNVVLYMNSFGSDENRFSNAASCYHVAPDTTVTRIGEYIPKNINEVVKNINPKTCLPR